MSHLTSGWNEFKKVPYFFPQGLLTPAEVIFRGMNIEMTNTMSCMHLFKELKEEQVGGNLQKRTLTG